MSNTVVIAIDVGGTSMKCALVRPDGAVHHAERHPTPVARGPAAVTAAVLDVAAGLAARARADGLDPVASGVAVPGVVDEANGIAVWSANLGFRDVPLRDLVAARLDRPAVLGHDVRAGGLAEARLGAGHGRRHVVFVAVGTGIAAAQVVNGHALAGAHGAAGELGHIVVRPGGPACGCGARGCLEAIASASAVARRYAALTGTRSPASATTARPGARGASAADVAAHAAAGDPAATTAWQEAVDALADGLLIAQALYDPEVLVLGGGLAEAGDTLLVPLRAALARRAIFHQLQLTRAALGDMAGCRGAAIMATTATLS